MSESNEKLQDRQSGEITLKVLPSVREQMDETGVADMDLRMQVGSFDQDNGDLSGDLLLGVSGSLWVEFEDGHRVVAPMQEIIDTAIRVSAKSEYGLDEVDN